MMFMAFIAPKRHRLPLAMAFGALLAIGASVALASGVFG